MRKRVARIGTLVEERIYLGGYEVYGRRDHTGVLLERQTLHVMDGTRRVAMLEAKTVDAHAPAGVGATRARYQYSNHLDSALLEADGGTAHTRSRPASPVTAQARVAAPSPGADPACSCSPPHS